jgi:hypothetical protein
MDRKRLFNFTLMNKSYYIKKIIKERGKDFYNKNKSLLDAEYEYIESLGDVGDIEKKSSAIVADDRSPG